MMVEPWDYRHKNGNSGVTFYNNAEPYSYGPTTFNGGQRQDVLVAVPRYVGAAGLRLSWLEWIVTSAGNADVRLGIYLSTGPTNLYPSTLLLDCGVQSMTLARPRWNVNLTLTQGVVWYAWVASTANGQVVSPSGNVTQPFYTFLGKRDAADQRFTAGIRVNQTYGALPASFPAGAVAQTMNDFPYLPYFFAQTF